MNEVKRTKSRISTISKYLQKQYKDDFPFLKSIKSYTDPEYTCAAANTVRETDDCFNMRKKTSNTCLAHCPHRLAKIEFDAGPISPTNIHYTSMYPRGT